MQEFLKSVRGLEDAYGREVVLSQLAPSLADGSIRLERVGKTFWFGIGYSEEVEVLSTNNGEAVVRRWSRSQGKIVVEVVSSDKVLLVTLGDVLSFFRLRLANNLPEIEQRSFGSGGLSTRERLERGVPARSKMFGEDGVERQYIKPFRIEDAAVGGSEPNPPSSSK